ncbi:hypothetical protein [Campylobacter mucosalis]|uniref:hypothetical protein n=1 Tax=Campylobacter mucosalis TaxID=202 RepID=UPI00147029D7|nr:hypothetical protein [Campylobacter mucosalis]
MNSLFSQPAQVEIQNFQTFTTEYVADRYGISKQTIRDHKRLHADELVENTHFVTEQNKFGVNEVKWTLKGIVVLGFFIRSPQAKNFRIWASSQLERELLKQAEIYEATRKKNLALVNKVSSLEADFKLKATHHQNQINGYKSQIAKHNNQIELLKAELVMAKRSDPFAELDLSDPKYQPFSAGRPSYKELWRQNISIKAQNNALKVALKMFQDDKDKNKQIALNLAKIQKELEKSYTAIGAVMAYCYDNDHFFINQKEQ